MRHETGEVQKGDLIADGEATSQGELALGEKILVAFMPWEGKAITLKMQYLDEPRVLLALTDEDLLQEVFKQLEEQKSSLQSVSQ
jgi:hypothetical protein